ncbi:MAG: DUF4258 domain-containing protein [Candidatus Brocadiales bacterium]
MIREKGCYSLAPGPYFLACPAVFKFFEKYHAYAKIPRTQLPKNRRPYKASKEGKPVLKPVSFSTHARIQMELRGAEEAEVIKTINSGKWETAKRGKLKCCYRFNFNSPSPINQLFYKYKTVEAVFVEEGERIIVVTVKVYYSNKE